MNQEYFKNWTNMSKGTLNPLQAIVELNIKTLQSYNYIIRPEDLVNIKKPVQLLEKQVSMTIENGYKTLDYIKKSFDIFESALSSLSENVGKFEAANEKAAAYVKKAVPEPFKGALSSLSENAGKFKAANEKAAAYVKKAVSEPFKSAVVTSKPIKEFTNSVAKSTNSAIKAAQTIMKSTESYNPVNPLTEAAKPAFDHNLANANTREKVEKAAKAVSPKIQAADAKSKKSKGKH